MAGLQHAEGRQYNTINLFSGGHVVYDNSGKLTLQEAIASSKLVIRTDNLKLIDRSADRGIAPIYIYQVDGGSISKPADARKIRFPILLLSKDELYGGKALDDSVYVFLAPLRQYHILQKHIGIRYEWTAGAPLLNMEAK